MPKKSQSKRDSVKALIACGLTNSEIAETLHISAKSGYIRKIRREIADTSCNNEIPKDERPKLTPETYYNAMKKNNGTKDDLAAVLGVCRKTLYTFEHDNQMKLRLARYMRVRGMGLERIAAQLGTKISVLEKMGIDRLPTLDGIKAQIEIALEPLADVAQWDEDVAAIYYQWEKASERLK